MSDLPPNRTALGRETLETAAGARIQATRYGALFAELGAHLRQTPPTSIVTCARGSSDYASVYGKYLFETRLGRPVASVGMSVASVYGRDLDLNGALFIAVSQSGRSPDLLRLTESAKRSGALVVGLINDEDSPLAALCDMPIGLCAGPELSVAATKSHLLAAAAFLNIAAYWSGEERLFAAAAALPAAFDAAAALDWWPAIETLKATRNMLVLGRGASFGTALEAALKFKETSRLHAEAFSAAEVIHGPFGLVGPDLPVLVFGQEDEAAASIRDTVARIVELGGPVLSALDVPGARRLPTVGGVDPIIAPLCQELSFYLAIQHLALARGLDPDNPTNLRKVTETR
ncbi:MAG: SIS domain-containing protein [Azospirillaceae bacterium]|nr:SIS domain-containing protein [Azospirillaceae bacterium]